MHNLFFVAIGGALGSSLRYLFVEMVLTFQRSNQALLSFPLAITLANIFGSFLMGILHFYFVHNLDSISSQTRLFLSVGVLGGFTTFSAFSLDVLRLINAGQLNLAFICVFSSVIFSILAIFAGFYLAKLM
ncbi:MAG: CrcB protein [Lentimonas sp.]|jgi:CrcB protein